MPGASVARIARAHGVNANQVFAWRRKYQQGPLSVRKQTPRLLPVRVTGASVEMSPSESAPGANPPSGTIQIELARATLRIRGSADLDALRTALEILAQ